MMELEDFSDADIMLNLEGQILNALTKHGGQMIVAGPEMESLMADLIEDVLTHPDRRRWAAEYLRRLRLIDGSIAPGEASLRTWNRIEEKLPPEGQEVVVMNGPHEQTLVLEHGLWWIPDRSMYVYYAPKIWRPLDPGEGS